MILLFFFIFHCKMSIYLLHFYFLFFPAFRSPVNEDSQDGVMHSDGKGQKMFYLFVNLDIEIWVNHSDRVTIELLSSLVHARSLSCFTYVCIPFYLHDPLTPFSPFPTRDKYSNMFNVCVSVYTIFL